MSGFSASGGRFCGGGVDVGRRADRDPGCPHRRTGPPGHHIRHGAGIEAQDREIADAVAKMTSAGKAKSAIAATEAQQRRDAIAEQDRPDVAAAGRSVVSEVWCRNVAHKGRTGDQLDAYSIAPWLSRARTEWLPRGLLRDASRSRGSTTSQGARLTGLRTLLVPYGGFRRPSWRP